MKFILFLSDTNRCDKNGDGMLTEDEVKEVGNLLLSVFRNRGNNQPVF
jgi:hypothetical protein